MFKAGVILYHKDIYKIYKPEWVEKCLKSIREQTFQNFVVYELSYGQSRTQLWKGSNYSHIPMPNHIFAMNHILDKAFLDDCDVVFNVNLDDFYDLNRFTIQLAAVKAGYDLISSNFQIVEEIDGNDILGNQMLFHNRDIKAEQEKDHNILCHPVICYTKKFWEENRYYKTNELGYEDLNLWKKAVTKGVKIRILDQILCYYRVSPKQTGRIHKAISNNNGTNI